MKATILAKLVALGLAAAPLDSMAQTVIDFRGVPLGAPESEWNAKITGIPCDKAPSALAVYADRYCTTAGRPNPNPALAYGGVTAQYISASFIDDRLVTVRVTLKPEQYSIVLAALTEKFGPPTTVDHPEFKTRGGLTGTNDVATWRIGQGHVTARKYSTAIDSGDVSYEDDAGEAAKQQRQKATGKAGASTL